MARTPSARFTLEDLPANLNVLAFIFGDGDRRVRQQQALSEKAGRFVVRLHNAIAAQYRDPYDDPDLLAFPYVNGGLYAEHIEIPCFSEEIRAALLDASEGFDWTGISPGSSSAL